MSFSWPLRAQEAARTVEFVENKGQWDARAHYAAHVAAGARLFVEPTGLTYALTAGLPDHAPHPRGEARPAPGGQLASHALRVEFVNPGKALALLAEDATPTRQHYLRGSDPARWATDARAFRQLRYQQLWPGTDLVLKENAAHELEYDLLLAPGANPHRPRLRYAGADALRLDPATGNLLVQTSAGVLTERQPRAWQTDPATGHPQAVACAFQLRGTEVSFRLGDYDRRRPLVIDPVVQFASYTGSPVENWGFTATSDAAGNLYTAGVVFEPRYPTTTGAYQTSFSGSTDMAIMKFNTGVVGAGARAWATYLGGSGLEFPHSLLVNGRGELLLLGTTSSTDYPTTAAAVTRTFQGGTSIAPYGVGSAFVLAGGSDIVLSRLNASGGRLRASTYLGGTANDGLLDPAAPAPNLRYNYGDAFRGDLALDPQGNVYVASVTGSANFPGLAAGATYRGGLTDGLVTSLDSSLSRVRWTTLVGGFGADAAYSLQRDEASGDLLVAGGTASSNLAGAIGGYQPNLSGGVDGFVSRLTAGGAITQSTYLGTSTYDQAYFVRRTAGGQVYVLGQTLATAWPRQTGSLYANPNGHQFIQQLAPDLRTAGFATVFGSGRAMPDISPTAFEVDCYGRLFVAGWGGGLDPHNGSTVGLDVTPNAFQTTTDGMDFYLMQLSDGARVLDYATFFGTSADDHIDGGTSRFDPQGTLYQALCACNQGSGGGLPIPPGAAYYTATNGSAHCNNAAFKFAFGSGSTPAGPDTLTVCARTNAIRLGGSPAGGVWTGSGVTGSVAAGYVFTPDTTRLGTFVLTYTSPLLGLCAGTSTRRITVVAQPRARITAPSRIICLQPRGPAPPPVPLTGTPAGGFFAGAGIVPGTSSFNAVLAGPGVHQVYYVTGGRCPVSAFLLITVQGLRVIDLGPPLTVCANDPPVSLTGSPVGGVWTGTGVSVSGSGYVFTPSPALVGHHLLTYVFAGTPDCPGASDTLSVTVRPVAGTATAPADTVMCSIAAPFRLRGGLPAGGVWSGPGVTGSVVAGYTFTPSPVLAGTQAVTLITLTYTGPVTSPNICPPRARRVVRLNSGSVQLGAPALVVCPTAGPQVLQASPAGGTWTGPGVAGAPAAGYTFTPSPALVGMQTLSYSGPPSTDPAQCPGSGQLQLEVRAGPEPYLDPVPPVSFCTAVPPHGEVLTAQPAGGVFGGPGVVGNRFNPALAGPGRHTLTYTIRFLTCTIVATQVVEVTQLPPIRLPADTVLCADQTPFRLRATPAGGTWSGPGVTAAGIFTPPSTAGTTVLTYTLPGGCGAAPYRVTVPVQPTFAAGWTVPDCPGNLLAPRRLRFEATGPAAGQVQWDFGDGSAPATGAVVLHSYAAGHYLPQAALPASSGATGPCPRQFALPPVEVLPGNVPNIITPNNDGQNDTFAPALGGCPGRLQVFSRWGQPVFDSPVYHNEWGGEGLAAGIYYYLLGGAEGTAKVKGWVEIVR
ncbi:DUF7948 domain-containing protein [Hymenobacter terricola]|uniref:DUF7948 domain-containing protein n=1 Tax=Hymenobacter terricola TaxID=2819236 RepID=UPI001B30CC6C|nr:gliding motility-associated C-terminal domain-containing protein [Hymenobacter terricola]